VDLRAIPAQPSPGLIHVVVEVPAGGRNKYEYLPAPGLMALDRVLHPSVQYPFDYGFVPNTMAEDGSPLDAMVVMEEPTFPGCMILSRPIGLLEVIDQQRYDAKLLCVPANDPHLDRMSNLGQLSAQQLEDIAEFFRTHRGMDGRMTEIQGWLEGQPVMDHINRCITAAAAPELPQPQEPDKTESDH
jgi:inorganic pyrophosphatase|tara:strand:+ start:3411 stop:3971 length:561 start_codon:yes stop_codon:yes gene_type:complete